MVVLVTPLVKVVIFPTTLEEKFWMPPAMEAAKSAPGREGMLMLEGACPTWTGPLGILAAALPKPGS